MARAIPYKENHKISENGELLKKCNRHEIVFPNETPWMLCTEEYFYKTDKNKTDGLYPYCKRCAVIKSYQYILDHPEQTKVTYQKYMETDSWKEYKKQNFIKSKDKMREWRQNHPDKCRTYAESHRKHDITESEWRNELEVFEHKCAYCGITEEENKIKTNQSLHKEHVDHEGSNDLRNAVPACRSCNDRKWMFPMEGWFREQKFFSEEKLEFIKWWVTEGYKEYIEEKPPYRIIRKQNEDKKTFHFELWTVDEQRNIIECIHKRNKRKEIIQGIQDNVVLIPNEL